MDDSVAPLGLVSLLTFCLLVLICELFYRRANCKSTMVLETPVETGIMTRKFMVYTADQIDKGVAAGIPLLIYDNLVINLGGFAKMHPGGKFAL
mmetsp:Transcript_36658/g.44852  ORF Transcript_36658/g.44852 Transcript_36658/m.44852 type:complete len:94 (-) Transcript_36658:1443-1724(-)